MRRVVIGAVLAIVLLAGLAPGHVDQASAAARPNTVSVDLARSRGAFPFAPGGQLSATPNSWKYALQTLQSLDALRLQRARVWLEFAKTVDPVTKVPGYARWHDYLATYHDRAQTLLVNWQTSYDPLVTGGTWSAAELFAAERDMLAHYKRRYPKIEYLEVENEKIWKPEDVPGYYLKYRLMYQVANAVNAMRLPGPALKVGGPTLDIYSEWRLAPFLDAYRADPDPAKRLDFVSYHQYLVNTDASKPWTANKDFPAIVASERSNVDTLLKKRNLPLVPIFVSEVGVFPQLRETPLGLDADLHIQAAALASLHYHYAERPGIVPFDWTIDHPENDRKDLFLDIRTGETRPYYNVLRMESMLPATRYHASSDALSPRGTGVYGLAAADAGTIAAMTWNYQWTGTQTFDSRVVFANVPAAFRTSNVRVTRYRIGTDEHSGPLIPVHTFVIGPRTAGTYYGQTLPLAPNELRLTVLTLTTDPTT